MTTVTKELTSVDENLKKFLQKCDDKKFSNNNTLDSMKFDWCLDVGGMWFATYRNNDIISLSGIHPWENGRHFGTSERSWRALFRGVQIESNSIGLNKHHMQSYCFHSQLPLQIDWVMRQSVNPNNEYIYITTNTENDASGKMTRINKTFFHLEKQDLVKHRGVSEVYNVDQTVWELNIEKYNEIRKRYN